MNKNKVALYIRVVAPDDEALKMQEEVMLRYASNNGYGDVVIYHDNGVSGLTLERPGLNQLTSDIKNGIITTVIVKDIARIARDWWLADTWMELLRNHDVNLIMQNDHRIIESDCLKELITAFEAWTRQKRLAVRKKATI
jgi:DNA invertase Pin-like site-specific DNA recombinase